MATISRNNNQHTWRYREHPDSPLSRVLQQLTEETIESDEPIEAAEVAVGSEEEEHDERAATRGPGIVEIHFKGRLGNNLFQYAVARVLADRPGWALFLSPFPYHLRGNLQTPEARACFPGVQELGPGIDSPDMRDLPVVIVGDESEDGGKQEDDIGAFPQHVVMNGYFQDYSLFALQKDRVREASWRN